MDAKHTNPESEAEQVELLAGLRALYDITCCYDFLICHPTVDRARAVLAKAEERPSS